MPFNWASIRERINRESAPTDTSDPSGCELAASIARDWRESGANYSSRLLLSADSIPHRVQGTESGANYSRSLLPVGRFRRRQRHASIKPQSRSQLIRGAPRAVTLHKWVDAVATFPTSHALMRPRTVPLIGKNFITCINWAKAIYGVQASKV